MSSRPLVSVVIPVFNGSDYLSFAIESVLGQSYPELEVLVVNDGSDDDGASAEVCARYSDRIRYFEKDNGGVSTALNVGVENMRGDYFSWLSHDDVFHPEKTALQVQVMQRSRDPDLVVFSDYQVMRANGEVKGKNPLPPGIGAPGWRSLLRGHMNGCTLLIPRHLFARHGLFDPRLRYTQDYDYWLRLLTDVRFWRIPLPLVSTRLHDAQASREPAAADEGDDLWQRIIATVPASHRIESAGSDQLFFEGMADFLASTPYRNAARRARELASETLANTVISVILVVDERGDPERQTLQALAMEPSVQPIVVDCSGLRESASASGGLLLAAPGADIATARNLGFEAASGDYVVFMTGNSGWHEGRFRQQSFFMQALGLQTSCVHYERVYEDATAQPRGARDIDLVALFGREPQPLSTFMWHRSVFEKGLSFTRGRASHTDFPFWRQVLERGETRILPRHLVIEHTQGDDRLADARARCAELSLIIGEIVMDPVWSRAETQINSLHRDLNAWRKATTRATPQPRSRRKGEQPPDPIGLHSPGIKPAVNRPPELWIDGEESANQALMALSVVSLASHALRKWIVRIVGHPPPSVSSSALALRSDTNLDIRLGVWARGEAQASPDVFLAIIHGQATRLETLIAEMRERNVLVLRFGGEDLDSAGDIQMPRLFGYNTQALGKVLARVCRAVTNSKSPSAKEIVSWAHEAMGSQSVS